MFSRLAQKSEQHVGTIVSLVAAGLLGGVVLAYVYYPGNQDAGMAEKESAMATPAATAAPAATSSEDTTPDTAPDARIPRFLLARVDPEGSLVLSGTAPAEAKITIFNGEAELGTLPADSRGEWVFVLETPLAPGKHILALLSRETDGTESESDMALIIVIPEAGKDISGTLIPAGRTGDRTPLVMLMPRDPSAKLASKVFQAPGGVAGIPEGASASDIMRDLKDRHGVSIGVIDYNEKGEIVFAGTAGPGPLVRVYIDDEPVGDAKVDAEGQWRFKPEAPGAAGGVKPGPHKVRIDALNADNKVYARAEVPFMRADPFRILPGGSVVVIQPGATLWRIAARIYGKGVHYTDIYKANADQIRDPDLIYPGQVFGIPPSN